MMTLPTKLHSKVVEFLTSLPNIHSSEARRALILTAGLDANLQKQLNFDKPPTSFFPLLITMLLDYGKLEDGRYALIAVLEAAKALVGQDRQEHCETIIEELRPLLRTIPDKLNSPYQPPIIPSKPGSAPPLPSLIIGREDALSVLKARLGITSSTESGGAVQVLTAIRGWPGVGKTTVAAQLAHDIDVANKFPDGILWVSLGPAPNLLSELATWGRALGTEDILQAKTLEEARTQLTALLRHKRMLLIVDDVWEPEHAVPFQVGGSGCAMLITTRVNSVAQALAPNLGAIYRLPILTDEKSLELLQILAPEVVKQYQESCQKLIHALEGLPLALQVAGHLLNAEISYGFGVTELLTELREGAKLLEAKAPADRMDLANETTPTIAVLLQKSTDRLDEQTRDCFAFLGPFAPKPATFDLAAMQSVWQVEDPKPIVRTLVDRGLLEFVKDLGRYQMHALLVMHANSLLEE